MHLAPEPERFAIEAVATGRYRDAEGLAAGVWLLRQAEAEAEIFVVSLEAARTTPSGAVGLAMT
jgi:hypothetical protein